MIRFFLPALLLVGAFGVFYFVADPLYQDIKALAFEKKSYDDALDNSKKLQSLRDQLVNRYNAFSPTDLERLERMLPNNVDNVKLVLELDQMAGKYGMAVKNVRFNQSSDSKKSEDLIGKDDRPYGTLSLDFAVDAPYPNLTAFLADLERSLRVVDVQEVSFSAPSDRNIYQFNLKIQTYWLK